MRRQPLPVDLRFASCCREGLVLCRLLRKRACRIISPSSIMTIVFRDLTNYSGKIAHLADGGAALGGGFPVYNYSRSSCVCLRFLGTFRPQFTPRILDLAFQNSSGLERCLLSRSPELRTKKPTSPHIDRSRLWESIFLLP